MALRITGTADASLINLPWSIPLSAWPEERIAALPRGLSRHVVRFVRYGDGVLAIKETDPRIAQREFSMLSELRRLGAPCVRPIAVVAGRVDASGEELPGALVTEHLAYSLPYRALFSQGLRKGTGKRLINALSVLLVRLHLLGFYWGDVSLSNALFRRDAAEFSAYLVDAETGDLHTRLSDGQRDYDLDIAVTNITGELLDLQASGDLDEGIDPFAIAERLRERYNQLWSALTDTAVIETNVPYEVSQRVRDLNDLGFDVDEIDMEETSDGTAVRIRPKVVDAGHHSRRLLRLTGLDVQENQARRLLNDLDEYRMIHADEYASYRADELDTETFAAHRWLTHIFEPTLKAVPRELRGKLEPAQIFHEILDHRWYLAQSAGHDVPMPVATASYVKNVLPSKDDERAILGRSLAEMTAELPALTEEVGTTFDVRNAYDIDNTHGWGAVPEPDDAPPAVVRRETTRIPVTSQPRARLSGGDTDAAISIDDDADAGEDE